jgi:hypothetical protein
MKIHLLFIALIISLPLVVTNGYSHSITCGIGTCPVGGSPIPEQPDNEILIFLSGIQGFLLIGLAFGVVCFGIFVLFWNRTTRTMRNCWLFFRYLFSTVI